MTERLYHLIPTVTSPAGSCLTMDNLQRSGIKTIALGLQQLIMKPGLNLLRKITDLGAFYAWPHAFNLNVTHGQFKNNQFIVRSIYDGSIIKLSYKELMELIIYLQPSRVILPQEVINDFPKDSWPKTIDVFYSEILDNNKTIAYGLDEVYITGEWDNEGLQHLNKRVKTIYFETEKPMSDALKGLVYETTGLMNLSTHDYEHDHRVIDSTCQCDTCSTDLTRAYLHHLLEHTPLLAVRFLIQHNLHWCGRSHAQ